VRGETEHMFSFYADFSFFLTFLSLSVCSLSLSHVLHSSTTHEFSGGGAATDAAAPPPEKKGLFFLKKKMTFSKILFLLDPENQLSFFEISFVKA
jgi:hypothetical protein